MNTIKRFLEWIKLKEKLHNNKHTPPLFKEGEIWWVSLGENIGSEINGKSRLFSRPILIFKKLSKSTFMGVPTSSQDRKGTWYVQITLGDVKNVVILSQARLLDYKRLSSKIGELDAVEMTKIREKFKNLYCP